MKKEKNQQADIEFRNRSTNNVGNSRYPNHKSLLVLAVLASLGAAYVARPVLMPIFWAVIAALALRPMVRMLSTRLRVPTIAVSGFIVAILLFILVGGAFLLSGPATLWLNNAPEQFDKIERKMRPVKKSVKNITEAAEQIENMTETVKEPNKLKVEVARPTLTATVLNATSEFLLEGGIAISCLFMFLAYGDSLLERIPAVTGRGRDSRNILDFFDSAEQTISRYLLNFTMINAGLGTVIGLGLWAIGMPNPLLWGVMAGCLNFIPYLGLIVGSAIVFFVALVTFDSVLFATLAPTIYMAANLIEANLFTPAILGKAMSVHVVILFLGIIILGWLWGIGGVLLAVPLMATFRVICEHVDSLAPIARLMGENPTNGTSTPQE